eukprot:1031008-Rhodomonas_salina.1
MQVLTRSRAAALATAPQPAVFFCADPNPRCTRKRSFHTVKGCVHYAKVQEVNCSLCFPADFNLCKVFPSLSQVADVRDGVQCFRCGVCTPTWSCIEAFPAEQCGIST